MPQPGKWLALHLNCTGPDFRERFMASGIIRALETCTEQLKGTPMGAPYNPHYLCASSGEQIGQWRINTEHTQPVVDYSAIVPRFEIYLRLDDPSFQDEKNPVLLNRDRIIEMITQVKGNMRSTHPRWNGAIRANLDVNAKTLGNWKVVMPPRAES